MSNPAPLSRAQLWVTLAALVAPYFVNDLTNIFVTSPVVWVLCDHIIRIGSLASVAWVVRRGALSWGDLALGRAPLRRVAIATAIALAGGLCLNSAPVREAFWSLAPWQLGSIPIVQPLWLRWVDCSVGVALVAVSEELIFRGAVPALLGRLGVSAVSSWLVATVLFGLAHWSFGPGHVVQTALIGGVFGLMARYGGSLWPVVVAHYVVDVVEFASALPV